MTSNTVALPALHYFESLICQGTFEKLSNLSSSYQSCFSFSTPFISIFMTVILQNILGGDHQYIFKYWNYHSKLPRKYQIQCSVKILNTLNHRGDELLKAISSIERIVYISIVQSFQSCLFSHDYGHAMNEIFDSNLSSDHGILTFSG